MHAYGLSGLPIIEKGDDLVEVVLQGMEAEGLELEDGDVVVITEKVVAKAEGRIVDLEDVEPSARAIELAKVTEKDPRVVELVLRESREVLGVGEGFIVVETEQGFICANAGIDQSNIRDGKAKLLPLYPDGSAARIRTGLEARTGKRVGVVIADSWGRPFRYGSVGVAIGASGVRALWDRRGEKDMYGRELKVTRVAVADCIASLASLILGEAAEGIPVVVVKGLQISGDGKGADLLRPQEKDLFRRAK